MTCKTDPRKLAASRAWKDRNRVHIKAYRKKYFQDRKVEEYATAKQWKIDNTERWKELQKRDRDKHGKIRRKRRAKKTLTEQNFRYKTDLAYRIEKRLRAGLNQALRHVKVSKRTSLINFLGCSVAEVKSHIETQFKAGMTWDNIHIDHIRPCCSFDLTDPEQQKQCFHYTNLQPLFATDNLRKSGKWESKLK